MDPLRTLTARHGFFTRQEALSAGFDDRTIARMVRGGHWLRFRRGFYAFPDEWQSLDDVGQHQVRCNAVLRSLGPRVALSHQSGVIRHGVDTWGLDLSRVHVTRLDGGPGRLEGDVVHHEGLAIGDDVLEVDGQLVLRPERCVIEAGSRSGNEIALALFDSGLRARAYDVDRLHRQFARMSFWPFVRHLHVPIRMADERSGSVGESRAVWWFRRLQLPAPEPQAEVRDQDGTLLGIVDWWWRRYRLMGEFDGRVKYGRLLRPGQSPGDAVFQEKRREDRLREATGHGMLRLTWNDLDRPELIRARFNRLAGRAG